MTQHWHDVCALKRLAREQRLTFRLGERSLLILQVADKVLAFENRCPHLGYPLDSAQIDPEAHTLTCPFHHWTFALDSGRCLLNTAGLKRFPTRIEAGRVQVCDEFMLEYLPVPDRKDN